MNTDDNKEDTCKLSICGRKIDRSDPYTCLDVDDYYSLHSDGIGLATKKIVRAALRTWACDGYKPQTDILKFLDQMYDEVSKGTICEAHDDTHVLF
jgi:hypothetical protein